MMLKEVLLLVLVGWMVMPAHPWKPPEHGYRNDDTSDKLDRPSPQDTQKNIRDHRNYIHHRYGDNNPTGPEIFRQLRHNTGKDQPKKSAREKYANFLKWKSGKANPMNSAWDTCKEIAKKSVWEKLKQKLKWKLAKTENSKKTASSKVRPKRSSKVTKRYLRAFGNYTYHGQSYLDPAGHGISRRQFRNRAARGNSHTEVLPDIISFDEFKSKFKKKYENDVVEKKRKTIFQSNMKEIEYHNKLYYSGKSSYRKGVSEMSDITYEELIGKFTCSKEPIFQANDHSKYKEKRLISNIIEYKPIEYKPKDIGNEPKEVDYRKCGAFNSIRNQGETDGCWTFSAISAIESQIFLKTRSKVLPELSEQYIVDCCGKECNTCNGNTTDVQGSHSYYAIKYVMGNGIALRDDYGNYTGIISECNTNATKTPYRVSGMLSVLQNNEDELKNALVHEGPLTIGISTENIQVSHQYSDGVIPYKLCNENGTADHDVLLVGYGTDYVTDKNGEDYWLIRNSWGEEKHDKGYVKIFRNGTNPCDQTEEGIIPVIENDK